MGFLLSGFGIAEHAVFAQSVNNQLWFEYMVNYSFANSFNLENGVKYSTLLESPRWRAIDYAPSLAYSLTQNIDLVAGITLSYTEQTDDYNTFEARPIIGTRIHFTPNKRVLLRAYARLEQRNFLNLDTETWEAVWRPRLRAEGIIPINKKSYSADKLFYGVLDAEWLFSDDDVEERFANRFRFRAGLGYRLNYSSRFEILYMIQKS